MGRGALAVRRLLVPAVLGSVAACGGGGSSGSATSSPASASLGSPGPNVQPIAVNAGPTGDYANGAFTTVTVCVPGTSDCQTIDGVLVDTGSTGLRLVASLLTVALPRASDAAGARLVECNQLLDSYQWGDVVTADVKIAGEQALDVPIQLVGEAGFDVPKGCSDKGIPAQDTVDALGANGILGVGIYRQDCGPACALTGASNPALYYACAGTSCQPATVPLERQVQNPVWLFAADNNGVVIELPSVPSGGARTVNGSMIFGVGTRTNNELGAATVYAVDDQGDFTTVFRGRSYPSSFVDSGSNGLYFLDSPTTGLATCPGSSPRDSFYCPPAPVSLTATNRGANGSSGEVSFTVANADVLFRTPYAALGTLGGPNAGAFDWGLPFFYGRPVFTAIEQQGTPGGTGPYVAY
jgi:hypothetical protein